MDESEDNMSAEDIGCENSLLIVRTKSKKRSLVERELETNLTARITSPLSNVDTTSTSRYGRARRLKTDSEFVTDADKSVSKVIKSSSFEKTPLKLQPPIYKMHASNSPVKPDTSKCTPRRISLECNLDVQIESIYHENISLSRFGSDEKKSLSPIKAPKVYVRKDLIQKRYHDDETSLTKNMFSPVKSSQKSKSHLNNILERSSEKYSLNVGHTKSQSGLSSVVKALDFDNKKKKNENRDTKAKSKSDLFDMEAKCEYQVGDLAWARMGTYPFWPCIVTREPLSGMFVKKKMFGRIEHDIIHVTFFGDNGRRSWIVDNMLRKFLGQLEFEATREKFTSADKKRDPRFYAAFFISEKKQAQWNISVEEAEMLLREPKRLRIDILYDIIHKARAVKTTPKRHKSGKITRTGSDVSLSESLYDTLFSEDDGKAEDTDRSRNKSRNKSLDVSEVVTACLDNMAAKTGITKIQRQSHMDRWLQKAKSKTPEKSQAKAQTLLKKVEKETKTSSSKKKKRSSPKPVISHKPYSFRKYANESQKSLPHYFDYGTNFEPDLSSTLNGVDNNGDLGDIEELQSGIGIIAKVESLSDSINGRMKYEVTPKIDDISPVRIIDEHNTQQNKNVVNSFLSENIETDKGNIIYDIQIEVDASSVQDEDQIKNCDSMFTDEKLGIALHLTSSDEILGDDVENQENTEKNNDSDVEDFKTNDLNIINQFTEMVSQTKLVEHEQIINTAPTTKPDIGNSMNKIKVNDNIAVPFSKCMDANKISLNDEEESMTEVKIKNNAEEAHQIKLVDKQVQMINNQPNTMADIEKSTSEVNANENTEITFDENAEANKISLNKEQSIHKVKINISVEEGSEIKFIDKQEQVVNNQPQINKNTETSFAECMEANEISLSEEQSMGKVKSNDKGKKGRETELIDKREQIIICEPHLIEKSMSEVRVNDNTDKLISDVLESDELFLNDEKNIGNIKINGNTEELHTTLIDKHEQIINNELHKNSDLEDCILEVNVKDNTIMFMNKNMKSGETSLLNEKNIIQAELQDNTKIAIVEDTQGDEDVDSDSIIHSKNAIIKNNSSNTLFIENYSDRLDTTKIVSDTDQSITEDTETRLDGFDKQEVLDDSSENIGFKSATASVENAEYEIMSDVDQSIPSKVFEDTTVTKSDEISDKNTQKASYKNSSFKSVITSVPKAESEIMPNVDRNGFSESTIGTKSDGIDEQNLEAERLENICIESVNDNIQKSECKNIEQECSTGCINICGQEDKCSSQNCESVSETSIITETGSEMNILSDNIKLDDVNRNELNKRPNVGLENMKITQNVSNSPIHYVTFDKSVEAEGDIFAHLPEIKLLTTEVSKSNNISRDIKLTSDISEATEEASKPMENGIEDGIPKYNATNEIDNDNNLLQNNNIVSAKTDQALIKKVVDNTIVNSCDYKSVPIVTNPIESSIHSASDPVMVNGFHTPKDLEDFEGDTSSINSEDIEPLSVTRNKMLKEKVKSKLDNPEFVTYLEIRLDDMIAEHPELNENEIAEYLYETWTYEKNLKSDMMKNYDIQELSLVRGLEPKQESSKKKFTREKKYVIKEKKKRNAIDKDVFDTASNKSGDSGTSTKRWLRPKKSALYNEVFFDDSRGTTPDKIKDEIDIDNASLCSIESELSHQMPKIEIELTPIISSTKNLAESKTDTVSIDVRNTESEPSRTDSKTTTASSSNKLITLKENDVTDRKIKTEFDLETGSINTASSEISTSKSKQKTKCVDNDLDDPEFVKYLELRQDTLTDENPQLTHEEIVRYLYKTWLYDESVQSDMIKTYKIEQSNLVKGLKPDQDVQRKKTKKKNKVGKDLKDFIVIDNAIIKDKPKRKTTQANYYNEDYSDIEDEIQMFEIMKGMPIPQVQLTKLPEPGTSNDNAVIEIEDEVNEVEHYFEELVKPKPNLFKGLIREKVCEICERTGNLVKCKSCNSMFHIDCVKKESIVVEPVALPLRGRKKKKKTCRKSRNLEDSESQSDEKSQDVSAEFDVKVEPQLQIVDAEKFEAQLEAKMKELLESNKTEIYYDSYSSDDGIDWSDTIAGKCEIVDVKLKRKTLNNEDTDFKCNNCLKYEVPTCFVCKLVISKTGVEHKQRCQVAHCHKYYHLECLDHWPQTQFTSGDRNKRTNAVFENLMCPRHVCHTCVSDDPRGCNTRFSGDKLARCVRCPATYHTFTKCVPAGTEILTGSHIICPRHYDHRPGKVPCHVNTGWCFICAVGGTLICCEYCPTSFHAECLNIKPPEGSYMCEDCETGRLPLYGEMVWVKLGHYRWWPGIILHPSEIPDNLLAVKHSPGEFVVRFFGQYDHYWVNRGRVFPFQEGDSGRISSHKSKINADFTTAMEHAYRACEILKAAPPNEEESLDIASSFLPPHYVKLKVNKPCGSLCGRRIDIEESSLTQCECNPEEEDPCGPYSQCLNRMLLTECGPICRAGDRCNNRAFEKRLYPKLVPYRTHHRGWGLKTLEDIKAGQFVIEYVGELIDEEEFRRRMNRKHEIRDENFYFLTLDKERMIDAGPKGNLARFMNHCCEPNCETQKWTVLGDVRVGLFAIHDIPANSEVTFNYNLECAGIDKKRCLCGAKRCPGYIGAKPKQDESQPKKPKFAAKRTCKKRKNTEESPSTKNKPKRPVGRPAKPRELTEIEKDLLIIKNATNGLSSDSDCSRLSSVDGDKNQKALKRKRVSISTEESLVSNGGKSSPSVKKMKLEKDKSEVV